ncbi:MAG: hypothetical protein LQ351_006188 [Letrouitia transgressa]|nr:MAG: hypothetical protein LQ351_006188 [Letrouitia transgressa]
MAVGINLGNFVSSTGPALQKGKFVGFSVPIGKNPRHTLQITLDVELMANLRDRAAGDDIPDLVQGLAGDNNEYCAILMALNSALQMVLYAPLAIFFISIISGAHSEIDVSYSIVAKNPPGPCWSGLVREALPQMGRALVLDQAPVHDLGTICITREQSHPPDPVTYKLGFGYKLATAQSFTAASNNFEPAIAVVVATFGAESDQALASTVGPLIEVPVLLGLVYALKAVATRQKWKD